MKKELSDQQKKFLEVLFTEAGGDPVKAKVLAGYHPSYNTKTLMASIKEEVLEATKLYIAMNAPKAAMAVIGGIDDPTQLGIKEKLNAAKDLLDRAGLIKTEKIEVSGGGGVMLLPAKDNE